MLILEWCGVVSSDCSAPLKRELWEKSLFRLHIGKVT